MKTDSVPKRSKSAKLLAVFERFSRELANIDDPAANRLGENWLKAIAAYSDLPANVPRSALASGMEQSLRELPLMLEALAPAARNQAARALEAIVNAEYPEFCTKEGERLAKIVDRGAIRSESEYYLIRHQIDVLEGAAQSTEALRTLYDLIERFEARRK